MQNTITKEQTEQGFKLVAAVAEAIREAEHIPSGVLYSMLMEKVDIHGYEKILSILSNAKLIKVASTHELIWIGPKVVE